MEVVAYDPGWLPQLASLARAHARLVPPGAVLTDDEVAEGLARHRFWSFYSQGLAGAQTLLAIEGETLLAAAQVGFVGHGWGYGAAEGDGPDWLRDVHLSLFWLLAWPGWPDAQAAAAGLAARAVGWTRSEGFEGLEAFRGGPGFLPFGTQLSSRWPHLIAPLRAAGFRQPRDLLVFAGPTDPAALPAPRAAPDGLAFRSRRGRVEAWLDGEPVGAAAGYIACAGEPERPAEADEPPSSAADAPPADAPDSGGPTSGAAGSGRRWPVRPATWAVVRRLYVDETLRRRGIGAALFAEQLRRLHARGASRYLLHIPDSEEEQPAAALYSAFGYAIDRQQVLRLSF